MMRARRNPPIAAPTSRGRDLDRVGKTTSKQQGCSRRRLTVLAEGCDLSRSIYWVHAWTVADGIITQVREYFNTSLTVTKIGDSGRSGSTSEISKAHCTSLWESSLSHRAGKSVPGLVLAI